MQISHDVVLIIIGAGIGLISSLITITFQAWINRKERKQMLEEDNRRKISSIQVATIKEVEKFLDIDKTIEKIDKEAREKAKNTRVFFRMLYHNNLIITGKFSRLLNYSVCRIS